MKNLVDYEVMVRERWDAQDWDWFRKELLERMRINVGLLVENRALRNRVQVLEASSYPSKSSIP